MSFIESIKERAKKNKKTIILPESMDRRVVEAAVKVKNEEIANIIIIGKEDEIKSTNSDLDFTGISFIDPANSDLTEDLINKLVELRKAKGMTYEEAKDLLLNDYMYYACMLVKIGYADGVVSGACHSTANTLRPALQIIKTAQDESMISSFFLMEVPNCEYGENGIFIFSDCGLEQNPSSEKLALIAGSSAKSFELLVEKQPKVAMLSHSTLGSAKHQDVDKVVSALNIAKQSYPDMLIDGEFQLDAAIVPEVAKLKAPDSFVAGQANVLIFPDLDAGNIGYKLVQRLAHAEAYGPITQGMAAPINDLSRGCSVDDIVGAVAITSVQASKK